MKLKKIHWERVRGLGGKARLAVTTNWPIKLTALALATVLWAAVAAEEPTTQLVPVQLEVEEPPGRTLMSPLPPVQALFAGSSRELIKLYAQPPVIRKTIPDTVSGSDYVLELGITDIAVENAAVKVQEIQPRLVTVRLDDVARRTVPVVPRVTVRPDTGYAQLGDVQVLPSWLVVSGPQAAVDRVTAIPTTPLELTGVTAPVRRTVPIDTTALGVVRVSQREVEIAVDVARVSERVLMGVPVELAADRRGSWVSDPPAVSVTLRGPSGRLTRLTRDSVQVLAAIQGNQPEQRVRLDAVAPQGFTARPTPDSVVVRRRIR